jgi:hypothetical protein
MKKILAIALAVMMIGTMTVFAVGTEEVAETFGRMAHGFGMGGEGGMLQNSELSDEEMIAFHEERLAEFVASGRITQEAADAKLAQIKEGIASGICEDPERLLVKQQLGERLQNGEGYKGGQENGRGNRGAGQQMMQKGLGSL